MSTAHCSMKNWILDWRRSIASSRNLNRRVCSRASIFESGKSVFELNEGSHHDHLVCINCGQVEEFYDAEIEQRQQNIAKSRGFALHDHSLALYGACRKKN